MTRSIVLLLLVCALLPASVVSITEDEAIAQDNNERLVWTCCVILKKDAWKNTDCTDKLCSDFVKELPKPKDTKDKEYVKLKRAVMSLKTKELLEGAQKEFKSLAEKLTKPDPIKDLQETGRGEINLWIEESKRQNAKKPDDWEDKPSPPIEQKEQSKLQGEQLSAQLASKSGGAAANVKLVIPTLVETEMAQLADGMESSQRHQLSKGKVKQRMQAKQAAWQSSASGNPFVTGNRLHPRGIVKYDFDQTVVPSQGVPSATQIAYFTAVRNAMAMWERGTCIHFIRNDDVGFLNNNWARFTMSNNRGAFSKFVGYEVPADILDDTKMGITMWNQYISTSVAAHELGHLIGLYHTNARSDRNTYVKYGFKQCLNDYISGTNAGACAVNELTWQNDLCNNVNARDTLMNHADEWKRISLKDGYDHTKRADRELCAKTLCAKAWQYQYFMRQEDKFPVTYDYGSIMHYSLDGCLQGKTVYPATYDPNVPSKQPGYLGAPTEHDFATVNHEYGCIKVQVTYNGNSANFFLHPTDVVAKLKVKFMQRFALAPATIGPLVVRVVATATEVAVNFPHGHIANQAYNGITLGTGRGERVVLA